MAIESRNPATGEQLASFDPLDAAALEARLARAATAYRAWKKTTIAERARLMRAAADMLEAEADAFGRLMTLEMGKLAKPAREEVLKAARGCRYYAEHGGGVPRGRRHPDGSDAQLHPLRADGAGLRDHAVELSVLAGLPLRRAGADGRQRRAAETRAERAAVRAGDRRGASRARAFPRACSRRC